MDRNEYVQLHNREDGVYAEIIPAEGVGSALSFDVFMSYLDKKGVKSGDIVELKQAFDAAKAGTPSKISELPVLPFDGFCEYTITPDYMKAYMVMYPPFKGRSDVSLGEVMSDLSNKKVTFGLSKEYIESIVRNKLYFFPMLIAEGVEPVEGHDAEMIYYFNTEASGKPRLNPDGTVDFHQLDLISRVLKDDVVAEIKPEDPGKSGTNISGAEVKPHKVHKKSFKHGRNLKVSEDGLKLITEVSGHVTLENDKIFVSDEYLIGTDVDTTTGDVNYDGNVHVKGNVRAGFSITATGDVMVDGVVEGATIIADGTITLARGIQGMGKGVLKAGKDIILTFAENASLSANGNVEADALLHSNVTARGNIVCHGKNGYIIGGKVMAGSYIEAKIIGSTMGTNTIVGVGTDPELLKEVEEYKRNISKLGQEKQQLQQIISMLTAKREAEGALDETKTDYLQKSMKNVILINQQLEKCKVEYRELSSQIVEESDARVKINGSIYSGVKIEIGEAGFFIKDKNDFCQYVKKAGEIVRLNM